jgi:hypothetical protein
MTDIETLMAIEQIRQLKARYFRLMDTKQFESLREVFAADAVFDPSEARHDPGPGAVAPDGPILTGVDEIVTFIAAALATIKSVHHGHTPEIEILSDTTARAIVPMEDRNLIVSEGRTLQHHGFGHYHETYEKIDGAWRIKTSKLTRLRVDMLERT